MKKLLIVIVSTLPLFSQSNQRDNEELLFIQEFTFTFLPASHEPLSLKQLAAGAYLYNLNEKLEIPEDFPRDLVPELNNAIGHSKTAKILIAKIRTQATRKDFAAIPLYKLGYGEGMVWPEHERVSQQAIEVLDVIFTQEELEIYAKGIACTYHSPFLDQNAFNVLTKTLARLFLHARTQLMDMDDAIEKILLRESLTHRTLSTLALKIAYNPHTPQSAYVDLVESLLTAARSPLFYKPCYDAVKRLITKDPSLKNNNCLCINAPHASDDPQKLFWNLFYDKV